MVRNYLIVTASYWGFTLVDGALRMLVLFHFFRLGYTPFTLAFLFLLYEAAGIAANLAGGYFASRFGIPRMLAVGQMLQIAGLLMLSALDPGWGAAASVAWVVIAQGIAGVAKDLTKTASKSAIKATSAEGSGQLFRWVAWFTGSKNAMKGIGFFIGGLLLDLAGFTHALWMMAALLGVIFVAGLLLLPSQLGKAKSSKTIRELFGKSRGVNLLAAARIFMFGARDVWFVVGLPVFLYANGWRFLEVGGFLAAWTIAYGGVQAIAPMLVSRSAGRLEPRGAGRPPLGGCSRRRTDRAGRHHADHRCRPPRSRPGDRTGAVRFAVRGEFVAAFVFDPGLCRIRKSRRRRRILLRGQCGRTAAGNYAFRRSLPVCRHHGMPDRFGRHAAAVLADHVPAAANAGQWPDRLSAAEPRRVSFGLQSPTTLISIILEIRLTTSGNLCIMPLMKLDDAAAHLEALGNPTRLKIYRALVRAGDAGMPVGRLQDKLKIAPSTLSHHIKTLMVVGLINQVRDATTLVCHANYDVMRGLVDFLVAECCTEAPNAGRQRPLPGPPPRRPRSFLRRFISIFLV